MTPVRIDCNLSTVLFYARQRLIDVGICSSTNGIISQSSDGVFVPPSTNYFVIKGGSSQIINPETVTAVSEIIVRCNAYSVLDVAAQDLINMTIGRPAMLQPMVSGVIGALNQWDMSSGAYHFLAYPMRFIRHGEAGREIDSRASGWGWTWCDLFFEATYGVDPQYAAPVVNAINEYTSEYDGSYS